MHDCVPATLLHVELQGPQAVQTPLTVAPPPVQDCVVPTAEDPPHCGDVEDVHDCVPATLLHVELQGPQAVQAPLTVAPPPVQVCVVPTAEDPPHCGFEAVHVCIPAVFAHVELQGPQAVQAPLTGGRVPGTCTQPLLQVVLEQVEIEQLFDGVHPHTPDVPPPPHVLVPVHEPLKHVPPHPSDAPQTAPTQLGVHVPPHLEATAGKFELFAVAEQQIAFVLDTCIAHE